MKFIRNLIQNVAKSRHYRAQVHSNKMTSYSNDEEKYVANSMSGNHEKEMERTCSWMLLERENGNDCSAP